MSNSRFTINSYYVCILTLSAQLGIEALNLPYLLAQEVGHYGWMGIIISFLISIMFSMIIINWLKRYGNKSIIEINRCTFGKLLGDMLNAVYIIYCSSMTIIVMRIFGQIVQIVTLKRTPPIVIAVFTLIPTVILLKDGINSLARFSTILIPVIVIVSILSLVTIKNFDVNLLMPFGENGKKIFISGIRIALPTFFGVFLLPSYYDRIVDKQNITKAIITANTITAIFALLISIISFGVFGENLLRHYLLPILKLTSIINTKVVERLDVFFIALWFPAMANVLRSYGYAVLSSTRRLLKLKRKPIHIYIMFTIFILLSRVPKNYMEVMDYYKKLEITGGIYIGFLCFCYLFSFINKRGVVK